jgi:hypothetical protein
MGGPARLSKPRALILAGAGARSGSLGDRIGVSCGVRLILTRPNGQQEREREAWGGDGVKGALVILAPNMVGP